MSQDRPLGLEYAILCCKDVMLPGPFAVVLPDDIVMWPNRLAEMASTYADGDMVAAMQVKAEDTSWYGIFRLGDLPKANCPSVSGMVEKPSHGKTPSPVCVCRVLHSRSNDLRRAGVYPMRKGGRGSTN